MTPQQKIWVIRGGIGAAVCALLTFWMVPNTKPIAQPSPLAAMGATAEAQKPSVSAIPDSAIPTWAADLKQAPSASPPIAATPAPEASPPIETADAADSSPVSLPVSIEAPPAPGDDEAPAPPAPAQQSVAQAQAPDAMAAYRARRAEWQAQVDSTLHGQRDPG
jgi:hypothetical protein